MRRGGARRVFIYTVGFMASCVCCVAWEPSPPGQRKQHHFKLECPLRRQVSCQKAHGCRIPTKSADLFPNNCCVHLSHSTERPLSRYTGVSISPLTLNTHSRHDSPITSEHVAAKKRFFHDMIPEEEMFAFRAFSLKQNTRDSHVVDRKGVIKGAYAACYVSISVELSWHLTCVTECIYPQHVTGFC